MTERRGRGLILSGLVIALSCGSRDAGTGVVVQNAADTTQLDDLIDRLGHFS